MRVELAGGRAGDFCSVLVAWRFSSVIARYAWGRFAARGGKDWGWSGVPGIAGIGQEGEQKKEGAEDVLSFGDPGDGFDVEWMPGEEGGDKRAAPAGAGHVEQDEKEQRGICGMEEEAGEVVSAGGGAVELPIEGMGEPGEGVPIAGVERAERPDHEWKGEPLVDGGVVEDVLRVIEVDEGRAGDGPEEQHRD